MFRIIYLILCVVFALILISCAPNEPPALPPATDAPAPAENQVVVQDNTSTESSEQDNSSTEPAEKVTLIIESWRNDDLTVWEDVIIPAFNAHYPDIEVVFAPTAPADYDGALNTRLEGGTAGDLITCRPFDRSLALYEKGYLASLNDLPGLENFSDVAKSAWITDDGSDIFCVPMASVIHGFLYNKEIFDELGLEEPTTEAEFFAVLEAIQADGNYVPLDAGTADQWTVSHMGFQNIGPNYWKGEEGRYGIIEGTQKFSDSQFVAVWESLAKWNPYLASGFEAQTYPDSQNLFSLGRAAIYPAGSWDISLFNKQADFELGAFPPPLPEGADTCYISDHTDIALGMAANTKHPKEARIFLEWLTTAEFAELYSNALPGFFSLSNHSVDLSDPVAQEFVNWRNECESTIRISYQILLRGEPNLEHELWRVTAQVINGDIAADEGAKQIQAGLEQWYQPQQQ